MPKGVYKRTEEGKKNMKKAQKGHIPWNKGLTKETDKRVKSAWNKGLTKETDERVRKIGESLKNRQFSDESKMKMSKAKEGFVPWNKGLTKETDERIKIWNKGLTKETDERVRKIGEKVSKARLKRKQELGYLISPEARRKQGKAISGVNNPNYGKTGEKSHLYGKHHSEETKRKMRESSLKGENHHNWNPNREEVYAPYGENFYNNIIRNEKWKLQNSRDMLTGTVLDTNKKPAYHHIDYDKSNDDPDNLCFISHGNHSRITFSQQNPIKSERYKKKLQENTLALKNGEIPKNWSPLNKELYRQEKLKQLDLSLYI